MPRFRPFAGVRYAGGDGRLDDLVAPPYDVIPPALRSDLAARSPHNAVHVELPVAEDGGDPYASAAARWSQWRETGVVADDPGPGFYVYRMGFRDEAGRPRQTTGVMGALELSPPGHGGILPHERTTPKDLTDRLQLLRACRANLSPIWVLSVGEGLSGLCELERPPDARATDDAGVHHRLWRVGEAALVDAMRAVVEAAPVVIADGHHRFHTALAYQQERREANGKLPGDHDAVLAYVVELSDDQLEVRAIHRLIDGLPDGFDLPEALGQHFDVAPTDAAGATLAAAMVEAGALGLCTARGTWLLHPRDPLEAEAEHALDTSRLDVARRSLPAHEVRFQHGVEAALGAVASGDAQAAVLCRPATVPQIAEVGRGGALMPPKTTFFAPKLLTGMVFRALRD